MCSRMDISPSGLFRRRRQRHLTGTRTRGRGQRSLRRGTTLLAAASAGRLPGLRLVVLLAAGLGDALLELLDAEPEVAPHGGQPAGTEDHRDDDHDPNPLRTWHCTRSFAWTLAVSMSGSESTLQMPRSGRGTDAARPLSGWPGAAREPAGRSAAEWSPAGRPPAGRPPAGRPPAGAAGARPARRSPAPWPPGPPGWGPAARSARSRCGAAPSGWPAGATP